MRQALNFGREMDTGSGAECTVECIMSFLSALPIHGFNLKPMDYHGVLILRYTIVAYKKNLAKYTRAGGVKQAKNWRSRKIPTY